MSPVNQKVLEAWIKREAAVRLWHEYNSRPLVYGDHALTVALNIANEASDDLDKAIVAASKASAKQSPL